MGACDFMINRGVAERQVKPSTLPIGNHSHHPLNNNSMDKINAQELRIGNWIYIELPMLPIWQMHNVMAQDIADLAKGEMQKRGVKIYPIPLTPELLERCGFVKDGDFDNHSIDYYRNGCIHIQFPNYEGWDISYVWRDNVIDEKGMRKQYDITLTSLHQLQNLFFALTGEELNVKM